MLVKDVMTKNSFTVDNKASVLEAKDIMSKKNVNKLPVLNKAGQLVGILTANDLDRVTPSEATTLDVYEMGYLLSKVTVEKVMTKKPITVSPEETVEEAARIMADNDFGCLPVMDGKKLVGIITDSDIFKMFIEMFNARTPGIRAVITLKDEPGKLSELSKILGEATAQIVSCVTTPADNPAYRKVTMKVTGITLPRFKEIAESCGKIEDIRKV